MSGVFEKERSGSTPYILFDPERHYLRMEGESFHENVAEFYAELDRLVGQYIYTDFSTFTFDCALSYFNSSTAKFLLNFFLNIDDAIAQTQKEVIVRWIADADNEIIVEFGEDFAEELEHIEFCMVIQEQV